MEAIGCVQHSTSTARRVINHRVKETAGAHCRGSASPWGAEKARQGLQRPRAPMTARVSVHSGLKWKRRQEEEEEQGVGGRTRPPSGLHYGKRWDTVTNTQVRHTFNVLPTHTLHPVCVRACNTGSSQGGPRLNIGVWVKFILRLFLIRKVTCTLNAFKAHQNKSILMYLVCVVTPPPPLFTNPRVG